MSQHLDPTLIAAVERAFDLPSGATVISGTTLIVEDLGADSLAFMGLVVEIETVIGRQFSSEEVSGFRTVGDIQAAVDAEDDAT